VTGVTGSWMHGRAAQVGEDERLRGVDGVEAERSGRYEQWSIWIGDRMSQGVKQRARVAGEFG
jgi:hypothetical protein